MQVVVFLPSNATTANVVPCGLHPFHKVFGRGQILVFFRHLIETDHGKANPLGVVIEIVAVAVAVIRVLLLYALIPKREHVRIFLVSCAQISVYYNVHGVSLRPVGVGRCVLKLVGIIDKIMFVDIPETVNQRLCGAVGRCAPVYCGTNDGFAIGVNNRTCNMSLGALLQGKTLCLSMPHSHVTDMIGQRRSLKRRRKRHHCSHKP